MLCIRKRQVQVVGCFEVMVAILCGMFKRGLSGQVLSEQRPKGSKGIYIYHVVIRGRGFQAKQSKCKDPEAGAMLEGAQAP